MKIKDVIVTVIMTAFLLWFILDYHSQKMEIKSLHKAVAHLQIIERPLVKVFTRYNDTLITNKEILLVGSD